MLASAAAALAEGWSSAAREFAEHCGSSESAEVEQCVSSREISRGSAYIDTSFDRKRYCIACGLGFLSIVALGKSAISTLLPLLLVAVVGVAALQ